MDITDDPFGWRHSLSCDAQFSIPAQSYLEEQLDDVHPMALPRERYQKLSILGEGGMGRVWLGWDTHLGRNVAIKEPLGDRGAQHLLREAQLTAKLEHAGVVAIHDMYQEDARVHFVMALVRGKTLGEHLRSATGKEARLRHLRHVLQVAEAMAHAHRNGIVHRDLTPHNVVIDEEDAARVIDWGLAAELELCAPVHGGGTKGFVSPEQRDNAPLDVRSDVWSLGALLFLVLYGHPPQEHSERLSSDSNPALARSSSFALSAQGPDALHQTPSDAAPQLVAIAKRCLAPLLEDRYSSADAVAADLRNWLEGKRVSAYNENFGQALLRLSSLHRTGLFGSVLALLLVTAALVFGLWTTSQEASRARRAETLANRNHADLLFENARRSFRDGDLWSSRDSILKSIAIVSSPDALGLSMRIHMVAYPTLQSREALGECGRWLVESFTGPRICLASGERIEGWQDGRRLWQRHLDLHEVRIVGEEIHVLATGRTLTVLSCQSGETLRTSSTIGVFSARSGSRRHELSVPTKIEPTVPKRGCAKAISAIYEKFYLCVDGTLWQSENIAENRKEVVIAKSIALAGQDREGRLWQGSAHGEIKLAGSTDKPLQLGEGLQDLRLVPNSPYLLVRGQVGSVRLLDVRSRRWVASFPGAEQAFAAHDGSIGLVQDNSLERWTFPHQAPLWHYESKAGFAQLAWSVDSTTIAGADGSGSIHVFHPKTGELAPSISIGDGVVKSISSSIPGEFIAISMDVPGIVRVIESDHSLVSKQTSTEIGLSRRVAVLSTPALGETWVVLRYQGGIRSRDEGKSFQPMLAKQDIVDIEVHPDRSRALLLGAEGLWWWRPGEEPELLDWPELPTRAAIASDGSVALSQGLLLSIRGPSGTQAGSWKMPSKALAVSWQPEGKLIATGHLDGEVNVWHVSTGKLIARTHHHGARISDLLFSPDGSMLAIAGWDASITVLNANVISQ